MLDDKITRFVVSENNKYTGMVTETDVAVAMREFREAVDENHQDHRIRNMLVKDIMSAPLITIDKSASASSVVEIMLKKGISALPVMDNGKLAGIVTRHSLVNAL
jgi:CBS domain-containing protein